MLLQRVEKPPLEVCCVTGWLRSCSDRCRRDCHLVHWQVIGWWKLNWMMNRKVGLGYMYIFSFPLFSNDKFVQSVLAVGKLMRKNEKSSREARHGIKWRGIWSLTNTKRTCLFVGSCRFENASTLLALFMLVCAIMRI